MGLMVHGRAFAHIAAFHPEITALRRDLHAHPELGFEEVYTAQRVKQALTVCGVDEIHTDIGKTGLVAVIKGQRQTSGRMVGLRADMDALPMTESNSFAKYADARANRRDPFFNKPAGGADICNIPVPVRAVK